jgi:transposase
LLELQRSHLQGRVNMETSSNSVCFVGLDISKDTINVAVSATGTVEEFANQKEGYKRLTTCLKRHGTIQVVMEATGGYHRNIAQHLHEKGKFAVSVVNPRQVRDFAKAKGILAKTDDVDARVLAQFGEAIKPPVWVPKESAVEELDAMVKRREQLVQMIQMEKVRLETTWRPAARRSIQKHIQYMEKDVSGLEKEIKVLTSQGDLKEKSDLLQSMDGVGQVTAWTLLARLPELGHADGKSISSLVGLAPFNHDSGKHRGQRHIFGGRSDVRRVLYMAALAAAVRTKKGAIRQFYERLLGLGKPKKLAITACMRKMLVILNAMVRDNQNYGGGTCLTKLTP